MTKRKKTEIKTLQESKDDFTEDKKDDDENVVKEDTKLETQDAMQKVETELELDEPKKENTTIQDLKDYLMEDQKDSLNVIKDEVKLFTQDTMQDVEHELKLDESKKEEKDDMLSTFEDLKPEMKSVDDLVTF